MAGGFVFSAAINLLLLSLPLYSLQIFTRAIPSANRNTLIMLTVIVVLALSIMAMLEVVRGRIFNRAGNYLEVAFRRRLFTEAVENANRGRPDTSALGDLTEVRGFLNRPVFAALNDLPWMPLYVVGVYLIHPLLSLLMVVFSLLLLLISGLAHVVTRGVNEQARQSNGRSARFLDALQGRVDVVRALGMHGAAIGRWQQDNLAAAAHGGTALERAGAFTAVTKWLRYLLQVAVTGVGAALVIDGHLSLGGMIATSMLVGRAMAPIEQTASGIPGILKSHAAWRRLRAHLKRLPAKMARSGAPAGAGRLVAENVLLVSPRDQKPILKSLSFDVEGGETLCIFGPNRSGKSSLARLLAGAQRPHSGSVRIDGLEVSTWHPADPRTAIGYLPQDVELFPGTVGENIARFLPDLEDEVVAAARWAGIHEMVTALPQGYDTDIQDVQGVFAGGTGRLIGLARAGFGQPPLMVLDEPITGLDVAGAEAARKALGEMKRRGVTLVVLSHQSAFLDLADKVMVINNGQIAAFGPKDQVIGPVQNKVRPLAAAQGRP